MTQTAQRFRAIGGTLFADRRPVSLEWAQTKVAEWMTEADRCHRVLENEPLASEYRRQAWALEAARREAERWQRASGPNAAEAYTNKVRQMLQESLRAE